MARPGDPGGGGDMVATIEPGIGRFGVQADGVAVERIGIASGEVSAAVLTRGAILQDLRLAGVDWPLTLGFPELAPYENGLPSCGALVGPVANRISGAAATLDGEVHRFEANEAGVRTLHGGSTGTHRQVWDVVERSEAAVTLGLALADGLGGFPGARRLRARFEVAGSALTLTVTGETDRPTWLNIANHSYWHLDGWGFAGQRLRVAADRYLPTGEGNVPTGEIAEVAGTDRDFREAREVAPGAPVLDKNWCLSSGRVALRPVAWLSGVRGVTMELSTTEPGLQLYDGRGLDSGGVASLAGRAAEPYAGLALEAQGWPDAPNRPEFPSVRLDPGEVYEQVTRWDFRVA